MQYTKKTYGGTLHVSNSDSIDFLPEEAPNAKLQAESEETISIKNGDGICYYPFHAVDLVCFTPEVKATEKSDPYNCKDNGDGGNPNTVKTVTGTMTAMFGDIDLADLNAKLNTNDAEVHVVCDASALGAGTINAVLLPYGEGFSANGGNIMSTYTSGYVAIWDSTGALTSFKMFQGTKINDVTSHASAITTTMTVIYHPIN